MDESFRLRAANAFGSLPTSKSSSLHAKPSAWSVAGGEVQRREWRRGKGADDDAADRDQTPCSSSFLEEEWGIKASIGKDPTLEFEDEEDEYDKVAAGTDGVGDRLFMNEVDNHASYLNSHNVLHCADEDPLAERRRLKEGEAEARKLGSAPASASQVKERLEKSPGGGGGGQLKSILKRKGSTPVMKERKRVRFDPSCITHSDSEEESSEKVGAFVKTSSNVNRMVSDDASVPTPGNRRHRTASKVPDYLANPSKYTRYSFNSTSGIDEPGNTRACMDYRSQVKASNTESRSEMKMEDASAQLPKSVTFVPRKKEGDITMKQVKEDDKKHSLNRAAVAVSIAAMEVQGEGVAEEEEGSEPNAANSRACIKKSGRKYRSKTKSDEPDS